MARNEVSQIPPLDFTGGVFIGITSTGECVVKGIGELDKEHVSLVTSKLVLLVSRLRNAALCEPYSNQLH